MRFRTMGMAALVMAVAAAAAPRQAQADVVTMQTDQTPQVKQISTDYAVKATVMAAPFVLTARNLQPGDTVRLIGQPGAGGVLQLRSHGASKAQVSLSYVTAQPERVEHRTRATPSAIMPALLDTSRSTASWRSASNRMRPPTNATGDSLSERPAATTRQRPSTRLQN